MSRSKYRPRKRRDEDWFWAEYNFKRRREDIATGLRRTRIYGRRKWGGRRFKSMGHLLAHLRGKDVDKLITVAPRPDLFDRGTKAPPSWEDISDDVWHKIFFCEGDDGVRCGWPNCHEGCEH